MRARARVVVQVDELRLARVAHRASSGQQRLGVRTERRGPVGMETTNAPAASSRWSRVAASPCTKGLTARAHARAAAEGARSSSTAARIAEISRASPQQPPMIRVPRARAVRRTGRFYAGVACGNTIRFGRTCSRDRRSAYSASERGADLHLRTSALAQRDPHRGSRRMRRRREIAQTARLLARPTHLRACRPLESKVSSATIGRRGYGAERGHGRLEVAEIEEGLDQEESRRRGPRGRAPARHSAGRLRRTAEPDRACNEDVLAGDARASRASLTRRC